MASLGALTSWAAGCSRTPVDAPNGAEPRVDVDERDGTLTSPFWPGRAAHWRVAAPAEPRGLVIALHGRGGSADDWFDGLDAAGHAGRTRLAVAAIDGGDRYWHKRREGDDTGAMVLREFVPLLAGQGLPTDRIALTGLSMGGYGALLLASELGPAKVYGVATLSAALWTRPGDSAPGAFDDREDFLRHDVFRRTAALRRIPVAMWCGTGDPFISGNRAFARRLPSAKTVFDTGGHDGAYWASHLGPAVDFLTARAPRR